MGFTDLHIQANTFNLKVLTPRAWDFPLLSNKRILRAGKRSQRLINPNFFFPSKTCPVIPSHSTKCLLCKIFKYFHTFTYHSPTFEYISFGKARGLSNLLLITVKNSLCCIYKVRPVRKYFDKKYMIQYQQYNYHYYNHLILRAFLFGHVLQLISQKQAFLSWPDRFEVLHLISWRTEGMRGSSHSWRAGRSGDIAMHSWVREQNGFYTIEWLIA